MKFESRGEYMHWTGGNRMKASKIYSRMKLQGAYVFVGKSPGTKHHFGPFKVNPIRIEVGTYIVRDENGNLRTQAEKTGGPPVMNYEDSIADDSKTTEANTGPLHEFFTEVYGVFQGAKTINISGHIAVRQGLVAYVYSNLHVGVYASACIEFEMRTRTFYRRFDVAFTREELIAETEKYARDLLNEK